MKRCAAGFLFTLLSGVLVGSETETIDGVSWQYNVVDGAAIVGGLRETTRMGYDRTWRAIDNKFSGELVIPRTLGGCPVTKIATSAFYDCTGVTGVVIPESVDEIGYNAFKDCSRLKEIKIDSLKAWCHINFRENPLMLNSKPSLIVNGDPIENDLVIPDGVEMIGGSAFRGLPITSVLIPSSVLTISTRAFSDCSNLTNVAFENGCRTIGDYAFYACGSLNSVVLPESLVSVGDYAFYSCSALDAVTLSSKIKSIGRSAFYACSKLSGLSFAGTVDGLRIEQSAFQYCRTLSSVNLPEGLISVGWNSFADTGLSEVVIPSTLGIVDPGAFPRSTIVLLAPGNSVFTEQNGMILDLVHTPKQVMWLSKDVGSVITIPEGVECIDPYIFDGYEISRLELADTVTYLDGSFGGSDIKELVTGKGFRYFGGGQFNGSSLTNVVIKGLAVEIGPQCFANSPNLQRVDLTGSVMTIGVQAFAHCPSLQEVVGLDGVTQIQQEAFCACSTLKDIAFPMSLRKIGTRAFVGCESMRKVLIPAGVPAIEYETFWQCVNLEEVALPSSCYLIEQRAFEGCDKIRKFTMPCQVALYRANWGSGNELVQVQSWYDESKKVIRSEQWVNGYVSYPGSYGEFEYVDTANFLAEAFPNCYRYITDITLHPLSLSAGIEMYGEWDATATRDSIAEGCAALENLILEDGIETIGAYSFFGCSNLKSVTFPRSLKAVNMFAFSGCEKLQELILPESVEYIYEQAFARCPSVSKISLGKNLKIVAESAFEGCKMVSELVFPDTLSKLESDAFAGFDALGVVVFKGAVPKGLKISGLLKPDTLVYYTSEHGAEWQKIIPLENAVGLYHGERGVVAVSSFLPREGDASILEAKYIVDSKKPRVKIRVLAFADGVHSFANVLRPQTFVDGTDVNVGDDITPHEEKTVAWKVGADWATKLSKVDFEILALEGGLLPLETIHIPAIGSHRSAVVSWNKIQEGQVMDALYWLYADADEGLVLENGSLKRADTGVTLVKDDKIVDGAAAVEYVYSRMGYQVLSGDELTYVRDATDISFAPNGIRQYAYKVID